MSDTSSPTPSASGDPGQQQWPGGSSPSAASNANLLAQAQGSGGTSAASAPAVPVNDISQIPPGAAMYFGGGGGGTTTIMGAHGPEQTTNQTSVQQTTSTYWLNYFYTQISNSPQALQQFSTEAELAGLVSANANVPQLYSAWQKLIVEAYNNNINGQNLTPWDILGNSIPGTTAGTYHNNAGQTAMQQMTSQQAADIAAKAAATQKQTQTQASEVDINYTDPDTARYVLNQASLQLLGRQATNTEVAAFTKNLNNDEALFPKMTQDTKTTLGTSTTATSPGMPSAAGQNTAGTTVVGYDSSGNPIFGPTGSTTTDSSNANTTDTVVSLGEQDYTRYGRTQLANDAAMAAPDYGAYQAAGPLFQAFLGALKGAVSGVGSNS